MGQLKSGAYIHNRLGGRSSSASRAYRDLAKYCQFAGNPLISTMRATRPAAGSMRSFLELRPRSLDVPLSGFRFLAGKRPADPFVARERRNVLPNRVRRWVGTEGTA